MLLLLKLLLRFNTLDGTLDIHISKKKRIIMSSMSYIKFKKTKIIIGVFGTGR